MRSDQETLGKEVSPLAENVHLRWSLLLVLFIFACCSTALTGDFLRWDDDILILGNERLKASSLSDPGSLGWIFKTDYVAQWRPLNWLAYVIQFKWFRLRSYALLGLGQREEALVDYEKWLEMVQGDVD